MHSAIEMTPSRSGRVHEESEAPASEISYHSQDSRAPLGHQFPPQGPNRSHTSPGASFRPSFSDPPLSRSVGGGGPQPRQSSPYSNNEKARFNYASSSRPSSPATGRPARSTYGQIPGAAQSDPNLVFAEGDMGKNPVAGWWLRALQSSIVVRWCLFILPVLALLWIPGILGLTAFPGAHVWNVRLVYWSGWLTVFWVGWWACVGASMVLPHFLRLTLGSVAPELRLYIDLLGAVTRYCAIVGWTVLNWILFNQLINKQAGSSADSTGDGPHVTSIIVKIWFGLLLCSIILLIEKLCIQLIAHSFHQRSYEDRIAEQKSAIDILTVLYVNSQEVGRQDQGNSGKSTPNPSRVLKSALKGFRNVAQTATTGLGIIASEIANERVLQPNSPISRVTSTLSSANKSKQLARRIFYSFSSDSETMRIEDIQLFFPSYEAARDAFEFFDRDGNGDATLEEMEMALVELHRERLALAASMKDLDSAVGRLDAILMGIFYIVAIFIMLGLLVTAFNTLLTSAGTFILGLSWLIGTTAQEILLSIIFLFIKHPYDVGDRIDIDDNHYTVKEMHLLSTVFRRLDGTIAQVPHTILNTKEIRNIRRSGPISEFYKFDVAFETTFEQIDKLRQTMLEFLESEKRDFSSSFDVTIDDLPEQGKLTLEVPIVFRSNWQNYALKVQRRNKWICALKLALCAHEIFGPGGAGNPNPGEAGPTLIRLLPNEPAPAYENGQANQSSDREPDTSGDSSAEVPLNLAATVQRQASMLASHRAVVNSVESDVFDGPVGRIHEMRRTSQQAASAAASSSQQNGIIQPGSSSKAQ